MWMMNEIPVHLTGGEKRDVEGETRGLQIFKQGNLIKYLKRVKKFLNSSF